MNGVRAVPSERSAARTVLTHPFTVAALAVVAVGYLTAVDPNQPGHYPGCPWLFVTGHYCPGCGGLRAIHDLFHGQFTAALSSNILVVALLPVGLILWLRWARLRLSGKQSRLPGQARWWWSLLAVAVLFWGLRNLPATAWLAP